MADVNRLVEVKGIEDGSGFLIADGLILTAWHVLRPQAGVASPAAVQVRIQRDITPGEQLINADQPATKLWPREEDPGDDFDFALLAIQKPRAQQDEPVPWASLPNWGKVTVTAVGYPEATIDWKLSRRDSKGISGWIESADNVRSLSEIRGTLTMRISDEDAPAAPPARAWPGMSGAAVFADQVLIGIVSMAGKEGDRHQLRVLPIDRLFRRDDVAQALARLGYPLPPRVDLGQSRSAQESSWNWPRPWDFSGYLAEKRRGFSGRGWLFNEVRDWYGDRDGAQALLVCADFGVGKSAFMAELAADPRGLQIAAYHFCHYDTIETLNPATFIRSVAAQLAASLPAYRSAVDADSDARRWLDDAQEDPASAFERAVIGPLNAINPPSAPWVLLVDALDEALDFETSAGSRRPTTIVRLLAARAKRVPWLRILATSRWRQEVLQPIQVAFRSKTLDAEDARNLDDIRDYVARRCARAPFARVLEKTNRSAGEIASFLADGKQSGGKFLYAVRVLNDVESGALPLDRLDDLPPGMDGFYLEAFQRRFPETDDYAPVGALLGVLCVEREPMSCAELAGILSTSAKQVGNILRLLEDFLRVRFKRYALDHLSMKQWLSQANEKGFPRGGRFAISVQSAEARIVDWARLEVAADRACESAYLVRHLGAYLDRQQRNCHFARLLVDFRWLDARLRSVGVVALLLDWRDIDDAPALTEVERAIRQGAHVLGHDSDDWSGPDLLASQMLGRVQSRSGKQLAALCAQASRILMRPGGLRPLTASLRSNAALIQTLEGANSVFALAALGNGRLASGESDHKIRIWNLLTGVSEKTLGEHSSPVISLALLADGRLVSGAVDGDIKLWNLDSGVCERTMNRHTNRVRALAAFPDGRFASASRDRRIRLWNAYSGECEATFKGHDDWVSALAVLPDGRLASGSADAMIKVWNPVRGTCESTLQGHRNSINDLKTLADGLLVSASSDHTIKLWDLATGVCKATLAGHASSVTALVVLPDGCLVSSSGDGTIRLWNPATRVCEARYSGHTGWVHALSVTGEGRFVSGSDDHTIKQWDSKSTVSEEAPEEHKGWISSLEALSDGRIASASNDGTIKLWNPTTGAYLATLKGHTSSVKTLAALFGGGLASGAMDHTIRLWDTTSRRCVGTLEGHSGTVFALTALSDRRLASHSADNTIKIWDLTSRECAATFREPTSGAPALVRLDNGRVASVSDTDIKLWNLKTGECESILKGHTGHVTALAAFPIGRLVSGSADGTIRRWNVATGACEVLADAPMGEVSALAVLGERRLGSVSGDKTIRIWQFQEGRWISTVEFVADADVLTLTFVKRAKVLVAGDARGRVHFLKVEDYMHHAETSTAPL